MTFHHQNHRLEKQQQVCWIVRGILGLFIVLVPVWYHNFNCSFFFNLTVREKQYLFQYKEKYSIHLSIHQYSATYPGSRNHPNQMPEQSQLDPFNTAGFATLV